MKVQKQSYPTIRQLWIREQLSFVDGIQLLNRFDFDDHAIGDYQVEPIATIEFNSLVMYRQRQFQLEGYLRKANS